MTLLSSWRSRRVWLVAAGALLVAAAAWWLLRERFALPRPGSKRYEDYVVAFQVGTAALDSGQKLQAVAEEHLTRAVELIPQEPAGWANRGLLYFRMNQLDRAADDLNRAALLAPGDPDVEESLGLLAESRGKLDQAVVHFEKACAGDAATPARLHQLIAIAAKQGSEADERRAQYMDRLLALRPTGLPVLMDRAYLANLRRDRPTLRDTFERLGALSRGWPPEVATLLAKTRAAAEDPKLDPKEVGFRLQVLRNALVNVPGFARVGAELQPTSDLKGLAMQQFLRLAPLHSEPDPPDRALSFVFQDLQGVTPDVIRQSWQQIFPVYLGRNDRPVLFVASAREVRRLDADTVLAFPGGEKAVAPTMDGVLALDWNNDYRSDFLMAGAGGLRFFQQKGDGTFAEVTAATKLPAAVLKGDYHGAWAVDFDADGDLDVLLAPRKGAPLLLRNNGDGTFKPTAVFPGVSDLRGFAWLDLDNDGAADAALIDAEGKLSLFMNERSGLFRAREAPAPADRYQALAVADVNDDGVFDLIALRGDGVVLRLSDRDRGQGWDVAELARLAKPADGAPGAARLTAIDLDDNGATDLVWRTATTGAAWLADGKGAFQELAAEVPPGLSEIVSLEEGGLFDLLTLNNGLRRAVTRPTLGYQFRVVRPRANPQGTKDQRVNSFVIGSEAEVRSGSLVAKRPVTGPVVHFGLGSRKATPVLRFVWTNGAAQHEFGYNLGAVAVVEQRLTGSCPFLFSWDGEKMVFVADFLWSSPLGMFINGQDKGGFLQTTDWTRVRGDQLAPRDGFYDLRVNANLWETHFIDHLALQVIDHPAGTETFVDERFFLQPTPPRIYLTDKPRPVRQALDHNGADVTDVVRHIDGRYLDRAGRGDYQGITRDHWVEIDLGDDAPTEGPVYLLAHGFIHPTDSSINFAVEQNPQVRPQPLSLEVPDGKGGWKVARPALGFPAGKNKTVVLRLDGLDGEGVSRRVRLRTNLEIHWDALWFARGLDEAGCRKTTLSPDRADLSYRGIVRMSQNGPGTPELPHYDDVTVGGQPWRDLIGFHTRFGDVKELVRKVDDRYVIMNAGDELRLRFKAPPPPPPGWKRDFVWVADGWEKDGNPNTRFGRTVLPLPYHGMADYLTPPGRLEDDPVYRRFPRDWQTYHTRHVTPAVFEQGLRAFRRPTR